MSGRRARQLAACLSVVFLVLVTGCGGGDDAGSRRPRVGDIAPALDAVAAEVTDVRLYQVTATPAAVELIVAVDGAAHGYTYADGQLGAATELGPAEGSTFAPADVSFDPERVLAHVVDELDDPTIDRFEVLAAGSGAVLYSARVRSDAGGSLLIDLGPTGEVLAVTPA